MSFLPFKFDLKNVRYIESGNSEWASNCGQNFDLNTTCDPGR